MVDIGRSDGVQIMGLTRVINRLAVGSGLDLRQTANGVRGVHEFIRDRREFLDQAKRSRGEFEIGEAYPIFSDRFEQGGVANGQYFHQDLHVAQLIYAANPDLHVDVGSRIDGFVAHVAAFRPVEVFDIRPLTTTASNIRFTQRDITLADEGYDGYCDSLSCLHTLEHFGLGRYGDSVDYYGFLKGWGNLARLLRPGGTLYFSVPISRHQRVEFNAHRLFSLPYMMAEMFADGYSIEEFSYVDDGGDLHRDVDPTSAAAGRTFDLHNGCGIFTLNRQPN